MLEKQLSPTARFVTMLSVAVKMSAVLGSMRWHVIEFGDPVLAYSDQPVVVWPARLPNSEPFPSPHFGPLSAIEVRVPLSSHMAILMTWTDLPDISVPTRAARRLAAELNAFVVSQSDSQWMHFPGAEPPIAEGVMLPLSRDVEPGYGVADVERSQRRAFVQRFLHRTRNKKHLRTIELADINWRSQRRSTT